jgi:hypothetical protein
MLIDCVRMSVENVNSEGRLWINAPSSEHAQQNEKKYWCMERLFVNHQSIVHQVVVTFPAKAQNP